MSRITFVSFMKRVASVVFAAAVALLLVSCTDSLPRRFASFLSAVEDECLDRSYSDYLDLEEYWMKVDEKFDKLYDEYKSNTFPSDVKRDINACMARYEYLRINSFVSFVEEHSGDFSEDDWLIANDKILELAREYKENRHSYNSSEKRKIDAIILHYAGIVLRTKTSGLIRTVREILRELGL